MREWKPIDTAPKDGTVIDLWALGGRCADCMWGMPTYGKEMCWVQLDSSYDSNGPIDEKVLGASHWIPLPEPPK